MTQTIPLALKTTADVFSETNDIILDSISQKYPHFHSINWYDTISL